MKITYTPNPLETVIELDEHEKKELWYKLKIEQMEDMMFSAHHTLTNNEWYNTTIKPRTMDEAVKEACDELDPSYWCTDEKSKLEQRVDELFAYYMDDLKSAHCGDCTCVACSCSKCHVEQLLGIDTTKGLGKHSGWAIQSVFSRWNTETQKHDKPPVSLAEALRKLQGASSDGGKAAYTWLLNYSQEHPELL